MAQHYNHLLCSGQVIHQFLDIRKIVCVGFVNVLVIPIDLCRNPPQQGILITNVSADFVVDGGRLDFARIFASARTEIMFRAIHHNGVNHTDAVLNIQAIDHANAVDKAHTVSNMRWVIYNIHAVYNAQAIYDTNAVHKVYAVYHPDAIDKAHAVADYNRIPESLF